MSFAGDDRDIAVIEAGRTTVSYCSVVSRVLKVLFKFLILLSVRSLTVAPLAPLSRLWSSGLVSPSQSMIESSCALRLAGCCHPATLALKQRALLLERVAPRWS